MIVYAPRKVTLAPHEPQAIRIAARPPQGLPDGEYRVHMLFRAIPPATPVVQPAGEQPKGVQFQLTPIYGVTIPVIVRLGNLEATAGIANVQLEQPDSGAAVGLDLTRTGTRSTYGEVRVLKAGRQGPDRDPEGRRRLYRGRQRHVSIPLADAYKAGVSGPGDRRIYRDFRRRHASARPDAGGAPLGAPGQRGASPCSAAASGCARQRCCWRSAPAASARPRPCRALLRRKAMDRRSRRAVPSRRQHPPAAAGRHGPRLQPARRHMCRLRRLSDRARRADAHRPHRQESERLGVSREQQDHDRPCGAAGGLRHQKRADRAGDGPGDARRLVRAGQRRSAAGSGSTVKPMTSGSVLLLESDAKLPVELAMERKQRAAHIHHASFDLSSLPQVRVPYRHVARAGARLRRQRRRHLSRR